MRVQGTYDTYDCEDKKFADGGSANLYKVRSSDKLVYKEYHKPVDDPAAASKISSLVSVGRSTFVTGSDVPGSTPQASVCWPIDEIRVGGRIEGIIMPLIPDEFFRPSGTARTLAFLIRGRADPPRAWVRVSVLIRIAEIFRWLAAHNLAHGDFSDANIVWRESPTPGAFLIDADGLQPADAVSPVGGMRTPAWTDPRVTAGLQQSHDQYSDWYALALAMYRGLLLTPGNLDRRPDGTWPEPSNIPAMFPAPLQSLLTQTLNNPLNEKARTSPTQWENALRAEYLLTPQQFNSAALGKLDAEADKNRPDTYRSGPSGRTTVIPRPVLATQFNPLPQPPPQRVIRQQTVQRTVPAAPPNSNGSGRTTVRALAGLAAAVAAVMLISSLADAASSFANNPNAPIPAPAEVTGTTGRPAPSAGAVLTQREASDASKVENLAGWWVPQLSSKTVGTVDDNTVYDNDTILAHFQSLERRFSKVLLLSSSTYSSFTKGGYWVVLVNERFSSAAEANSWCDSQNLDANNCFAKRLTHSGTPSGNTVNR